VRTGAYQRSGFVTGAFAAGYGVARIICEFFREPDPQLGFLFGQATNGLTALGVAFGGNRARVHHAYIGRLVRNRIAIAGPYQSLAHQLGLVLVHLAAQRQRSQRLTHPFEVPARVGVSSKQSSC